MKKTKITRPLLYLELYAIIAVRHIDNEGSAFCPWLILGATYNAFQVRTLVIRPTIGSPARSVENLPLLVGLSA